MDEQQKAQAVPAKTKPKKPRTEPPTLEERGSAVGLTPSPPPSPPDESREPEQKKPKGRCVVVRIPIGELLDDGEAYQISRRGWPREMRQRRLTASQGQALAMIRLGMLERGECLDASERYFLSANGETKKVPIESKEEAICRLLEYVSNAIELAGKK